MENGKTRMVYEVVKKFENRLLAQNKHDRQTDRQTGRQTDRQTDRQTLHDGTGRAYQ